MTQLLSERWSDYGSASAGVILSPKSSGCGGWLTAICGVDSTHRNTHRDY
jgi:hypothetical protein